MPELVNNNVTGRINPIYIVKAEDLTEAGVREIAFYKVEKLIETSNNYVELQKCYEISKTEYTKLIKNTNSKIKATKAQNFKIPWSKIIRIENIIYNK